MDRIQTLPKMIRDQFDINIQLSTELNGIIQEETVLTEKNADYQSRLKALETDFATNKKRFEYTSFTEAIGLTLRTQRLKLPTVDLHAANSSARQRRMSEISEAQIALDQMLSELSFPQALVQSLAGSVSLPTDADRQALNSKIQELIANRIEIVEKLKSGYNRIFKLLQDIEFTTRTIVSTARKFGELLDRHLLWTRSSKRLSTTDLLNLRPAFKWAFEAGAWHQLIRDLSRSLQQHQIIWPVGVIIALALLLGRRRTSRKLNDINTWVQQQPLQDSISLSFKALGLTVLLAVIWPFIMAFPAVVLLKLQQIAPHTRATASGLLAAAQTLLILSLLYHISRKNGLAHLHFRWAESTRQTFIGNLRWFIPIAVVCHFIVPALDSIPTPEYSNALATFTLIVWSVAVVVILARILRFKGGVTSALLQKHPKSTLARLRYVWFPLVISIPLFILYLTVQGYYYSALKIDQLMSLTTILIFGLIILNDMVLRLLMLTRRKIALQKARIARQLQQEKQADSDSDPAPAASDADQTSPMESTIGMEAIGEQTRTLLKTVIFFLGLIGLWVIWEPISPAFGILQNVNLWSYTAVVDGASQLRAITLADTAMAIMVITITVIAVRNLPGLLEMILLNWLPMDPGARYAYAAIFRYTLTAAGIIIALNSVGIRWSSLRWLVAALGVGIGFGLQEIVANFICGLIILFERPVRVGDIVTVGTTEGIVTKIRIRATTIRDWDLKELLVPNKEFITTRLLNWSLSDRVTRLLVAVGVAYGSDVDKAFTLMQAAAAEHELVLADPEPVTSFDAFGDNALTLTLRAYLSPAGTDNLIKTKTDLHKAINQKFADAGIEISFPQRTVHLGSKDPLEVRVVSGLSGSKFA
jgi:potassium efflux system protein